MEVKINREIRNYTEKVFFGLSLRQFICSICACFMAVLLYFIASAGLGFFKYNGLPLEQFIKAFVISEILTPKELKFKAENIYYEAIKPFLDEKEKEELKKK